MKHPCHPALPWLLALVLGGCASTAPPPAPHLREGDFMQRVQVQERGGVRVSAAVPSAKESAELFDKPLYKLGVQPVWLKIENRRAHESITFLPVGLDPAYYTPHEVASIEEDRAPTRIAAERFLNRRMVLVVPPGETKSGFLFTELDEGTKAFNVDIAGQSEGSFDTFTFFIPVPGLAIDHYAVDFPNLYRADQWMDFDDPAIVQAIESFACCVTDKSGQNNGDPLNLVIIGDPMDLYTAFIRAGWDETETVTGASAWKTMRSFFSGGEYRYSPVSSLYVFGRPQDVALQKARENIHERNHLRLWMTPARYRGVPVWIGQISRDIGVRFTTKTITTHKIDPDVDETREFLLEDLAYAQSVRMIGYAGGVGRVPMERPRGNLTGDPWFSDGYRLVLWVTSRPTPLSEVGFLEWRRPFADKENAE